MFFSGSVAEFFEDWNDWRSKLLCDTCRNEGMGEAKMKEPLDGTHGVPACGHARSRKSADGMMFGGFFLPSAVFWLPGEAHPLNYEVTGWGFVMFSFPSQNVV